jgi:hypothetical protein
MVMNSSNGRSCIRDIRLIRGCTGRESTFVNRGKGISEIEGKGAMGSAEQGGSRASSIEPR